MEWGSASDGKRIYVSIANSNGIPTAVGRAGSWAALDPETGQILWQVGEPNGAISLGPLAAVDGVVYASSMAGSATAPTLFALNANTGQTLWSFAAGSSVNAGATVGGSLAGWSAAIASILALEFDVVVPSTGPLGTRADLEAFKARLDSAVGRASR